jgi:hypothetical protein
MEKKVMDGETVILPVNMGKLLIMGYEKKVGIAEDGTLINKLPIDFKRTRELWDTNEDAREKRILIRHLNKHTDGKVYKFVYNKSKARYKNKSAYRFKATRTHNRNLANVVRNKTNNYPFKLFY